MDEGVLGAKDMDQRIRILTNVRDLKVKNKCELFTAEI